MPTFTIRNRCLAALVAGVIIHILIFRPWIPYSRRESQMPGVWPMVILLAAVGLLVTFGAQEKLGLIVGCVVAGMFASNALLIGFDWLRDPTTHYLFPLEFIMIAFAIVPASCGAFVSHLIVRSRT